MDKFIIEGQNTLSGEITVSGAKNCALKLLAASLLTTEPVTIKNVPAIADVQVMVEILKDLGAEVNQDNLHQYTICCRNVKKTQIERPFASKLRTSIMFVAPLLSRFHEANFPHPGGCLIGQRPIDMYLDGFNKMGCQVSEDNQFYHIKCRQLIGSHYVFPWISHTVTESMIMAATLAKGQTTLINAACEPEVGALIQFLNQLGAKIKGTGSHTIIINGVKKLSGGEITVIPDRIEAGTFAILGGLTASDLLIKDCEPKHLDTLLAHFDKVNVPYQIGQNYLKVQKAKELKATQLRTHEYPGFVTDLQAPFTVLLTQAKGISLVHEIIYEGRLFYTDKLVKMGAKIIMCDPHRVIVEGPTPLHGTTLESPDIRAGIALIIAALIAEDKSEISNIYQVDRGYENISERLTALGAKIKRI